MILRNAFAALLLALISACGTNEETSIGDGGGASASSGSPASSCTSTVTGALAGTAACAVSRPDDRTLSIILRDPKTNVRSGSIILLANEPLAPRAYTSADVKNFSASIEAVDGRIFAAAGGIGSVTLMLTAIGGAGTADTHGTVDATTVAGGSDGGISEARLTVSF